MRLLTIIFLILFNQTVFAQSAECVKSADKAEKKGTDILPRIAFKVTGNKRLYFYTAPDAGCRTDTFVIPGDELIAYTDYKSWVSVMYINPKTGDDVEGWVQSSHLKYLGTEGPG